MPGKQASHRPPQASLVRTSPSCSRLILTTKRTKPAKSPPTLRPTLLGASPTAASNQRNEATGQPTTQRALQPTTRTALTTRATHATSQLSGTRSAPARTVVVHATTTVTARAEHRPTRRGLTPAPPLTSSTTKSATAPTPTRAPPKRLRCGKPLTASIAAPSLLRSANQAGRKPRTTATRRATTAYRTNQHLRLGHNALAGPTDAAIDGPVRRQQPWHLQERAAASVPRKQPTQLATPGSCGLPRTRRKQRVLLASHVTSQRRLVLLEIQT